MARRCPIRCSSASSAPTRSRLRERADEVKAVMRASPNTRGVNDNWNESVKVLRLEVDQSKARALGVTSQSIAQASQDHPVAAPTWASTARATS